MNKYTDSLQRPYNKLTLLFNTLQYCANFGPELYNNVKSGKNGPGGEGIEYPHSEQKGGKFRLYGVGEAWSSLSLKTSKKRRIIINYPSSGQNCKLSQSIAQNRESKTMKKRCKNGEKTADKIPKNDYKTTIKRELREGRNEQKTSEKRPNNGQQLERDQVKYYLPNFTKKVQYYTLQEQHRNSRKTAKEQRKNSERTERKEQNRGGSVPVPPYYVERQKESPPGHYCTALFFQFSDLENIRASLLGALTTIKGESKVISLTRLNSPQIKINTVTPINTII
jgi:hypothetical protein